MTHNIGMTQEDGQLGAACCIPHPRRAIPAAGGHDAVALRAEGRVVHHILVTPSRSLSWARGFVASHGSLATEYSEA